MKISRLISAVVLAAAPLAVVAQSAGEILRAAASKISSAPSVEAQFTVNGADGPVQGSAVVSGAYFALTTPVVRVWYDGRTQWTMLCSTGEVSITEPTQEEVMETNPFAILRHYDRQYSVRRLSDASGRKRVELTPLSNSSVDIERAIILVGPDGWPSGVEIHFKDGRTLGAAIDHISAGGSKPVSAFRFNPALTPASEIVDLR